MIDLNKLLVKAIEKGASDIHLNAGLMPVMRVHTELVQLDHDVITNDDSKELLIKMVGQAKFEIFEKNRDLDFSTVIEDGSRFRVNAHYQNGTIAMSFRSISSSIPDIELLNLPDVVKELIELPRGLILVTGPTGSGKSTTLASIIQEINKRFKKRIITLEDPVEYALKNQNCMIEQREIGMDCPTFASGLKHALRQDPDVILVGEMRDLETTSATITAAETGHLVFSTLHTVNTYQTIERIVDIYPGSQQNQIRSMLANTLQAVISQTLFKRVDQPGMVPCVEILLCTSAIRNCIRENRLFEIPNVLETSRKLGMQLLDHSIADMCQRGFIDKEESIMRATNPGKMHKVLNGETALV